MFKARHVLIAITVIGVMWTTRTTGAQQPVSPYRLVGYYTSYSITDTPPYFVTDVPVDRLTDLNYYAVDISANGQCVSTDPWADTKFPYPGDKPTERLRGNFKQLQLLKKSHPNLQILMTIGGWDQSK